MNLWYVIKSRPKKEAEVFARLQGAGYDLFLPQLEGIAKPRPLFPSYLFIEANLRQAAEHRLIRYTRGVSHVLGDGEGPRPIATDIIEALKAQTQDGSLIRPELLLREGDTVQVRRGLLKDLIGIIERHCPDQKRVQVLFKWWSSSMRAKLKYRDLERAA